MGLGPEIQVIDCWMMFERERGVSVDRVVCDPQLRKEFIESASKACRYEDEREILWTLMRLRKRKLLKKC